MTFATKKPGPGVCLGDPGDQGQADDGRDHEPPGRDHQGGGRGHRQPGERLVQPMILERKQAAKKMTCDYLITLGLDVKTSVPLGLDIC